MKILNIGSINIDKVFHVDHIVNPGETLLALDTNEFIGGKGLNQSLAMSRAGLNVIHAGKIGMDGTYIIEMLNRNKINTNFINIDKNTPTGCAFIQKDKKGNNSILIVPSVNFMISVDEIDKVFNNFNGEFLVLQNETNNIDYIINKAIKRHLKIIFNPAPFNKNILDLNLEKIDYLIINETEAKSLLNIFEEVKREYLINEISKKYKNNKIILTLGERGAVYINGDFIFYRDAFRVNVVDTTAAGDTFVGYIVKGIVKGYSINKMMTLASAAAGLTVSKLGATPSIPNLDEVKEFLISKGVKYEN